MNVLLSATALKVKKTVRFLILATVVIVPLLPVTSSFAETLTVGTIERPPFAYRDDLNVLTGFSVELWEQIARRSQYEYNWVEHKKFSDMIDIATSGEVDLAIANISITAAREKTADFSQPIFTSGMSIGVKKGSGASILELIWESGILWFLGGALLLVFLIANIIWYFERGIEDARHDYFRDDYFGGVWDAFWWAFIIMTMGGFEKEVPHKIINRALAMFWIVVSLFFISTLTAKITTALTIAELETGIESYRDLKGKRVGVTEGSSHQKFMTAKGIKTIAFPTLDAMYSSLKDESIDAIIADSPILSYYATHEGADWLIIAAEPFNSENLGILLPENSPHTEAINGALLEIREDGSYAKLLAKYFGEK